MFILSLGLTDFALNEQVKKYSVDEVESDFTMVFSWESARPKEKNQGLQSHIFDFTWSKMRCCKVIIVINNC